LGFVNRKYKKSDKKAIFKLEKPVFWVLQPKVYMDFFKSNIKFVDFT